MSFTLFDQDSEQKLPTLGNAFLDCGAYSVLTGVWDSLPLSDYARFVAERGHHFRLMAAPDVIGNAKATCKQLHTFVDDLKACKAWDRVKGRILVTYHLTDRDYPVMEEMLTYAWKQGIRWLAIGGIVTPGTSIEERWVGITELLRRVRFTSPLGAPRDAQLQSASIRWLPSGVYNLLPSGLGGLSHLPCQRQGAFICSIPAAR